MAWHLHVLSALVVENATLLFAWGGGGGGGNWCMGVIVKVIKFILCFKVPKNDIFHKFFAQYVILQYKIFIWYCGPGSNTNNKPFLICAHARMCVSFFVPYRNLIL